MKELMFIIMSQLPNFSKSKELDNLIHHSQNGNLAEVAEHIRLSYAQILKVYIQFVKRYEKFKAKITDEALKKFIHLVDHYVYDENGKLNWHQISELMPPNIEKKIKMEYKILTENEIKLCCLVLFEVDSHIICNILPLSRNYVYVAKSKIKQKTEIKKIRECLKFLLLI